MKFKTTNGLDFLGLYNTDPNSLVAGGTQGFETLWSQGHFWLGTQKANHPYHLRLVDNGDVMHVCFTTLDVDDDLKSIPPFRNTTGPLIWIRYQRDGTLTIYKDCLGLLDLYYAETSSGAVFSNRLCWVLEYLGRSRSSLNRAALDRYSTYLQVPGSESLIAPVKKLLGGEVLRLADDQIMASEPQERAHSPSQGGRGASESKNGKLPYGRRFPAATRLSSPKSCCRVLQWIDFDYTPASDSVANAAKKLCDLIKTSLYQAISRVSGPIGLFLSGGFDSTLLLALLKSITDRPIIAYSAACEEGPDEVAYARYAANYYDVPLVTRSVGPEQVEELLPQVAACLEEPSGNPSALATYVLSMSAAKEVACIVSGLGSDEIFAGHWKHVFISQVSRFQKAFNLLPVFLYRFPFRSKWKKAAIGLEMLKTEGLKGAYLSQYAFPTPGRGSKLAPVPFLKHSEHDLGFVSEVDIRLWLCGDIGRLFYKITGCNGLIGILPFCSEPVVSFGIQLPLSEKIRRFQGKWHLKEAFGKLVPKKIINRKRYGFVLPVSTWLRTSLAQHLKRVLLDTSPDPLGLIDRKLASALIDQHLRGRRDWGEALWGQLMLKQWYEVFGQRYIEL